jgi:Fe-S-cluster-containing hydrogenase component 2
MSSYGLPIVDPGNCTACNDCVVACPLDLFVLMPEEHHLIVQCRNLLEGESATSVCSAACNACGRCVADAEPGLIEMHSGLAVIDYNRIEVENPAAIARCPTNAIVWVEGAQVFPDLELVESEAT